MMKIRQHENLQKRNASADILKAMSIFAVVFIHGSFLIPVSQSRYDIDSESLRFLGHMLRFCVPVFIFLWAYFTEKSVLKSSEKTYYNRIYKLFIPFVFWSSVYFIILADLKNLNILTLISRHWVGYGWSGQYYFIILFQLILLFGFIRKLTLQILHYPYIIILISFCFFAIISYSNWFEIGIIGKLSYRPFIYWLPYAILGVIHAHKNIIKWSIPIIIAYISPVLILAEIYIFNPNLLNEYMLPSVFITTILLISTTASKLTYENLPPWIAVLVQTLSNSTLGIFCLNPLVIILFSPAFQRIEMSVKIPGISIFMSLISTILIMIICYIIIEIFKKIRLGKLISN